MFFGCLPCCDTCPDYSSNGIVNFYLDVSVRASAGSFTASNGTAVPSMDTGIRSAADWFFPYNTSGLYTNLFGVPAYDFTDAGGIRFTGKCWFRITVPRGWPLQGAIGYSPGLIGLEVRPSLINDPGTLAVPLSFPNFNYLMFSPCELYWRGDEDLSGSFTTDFSRQPSGRRFGTFDLIAETLSTRSRYVFGSPTPFVNATTDFTLSAGAVSIDETLQDTNNWITDYLGNPAICHRFNGSSDKSLSVMDGTVPLAATWTWNDITHDGNSFYSSFLEITCREFLIKFDDGTIENALPWWTDSLATFVG